MPDENKITQQAHAVEAVPATVPETQILNVFGRPKEYDPIRTIERVRAYLESPRAVGGNLKIPSVEGLAVYLKIHRSTIYDWAKIYPDFSDILEDLMSQQAAMLVENGLSGTYNSTITKLMLTKHGYKDQSDVTTNNKDITVKDRQVADTAIDKFLTKKPDGSETNTSVEKQGKDIAPVQVPPESK